MQGVKGGRILCLDIGDKRVGVAISDPLGLTAQGITTLHRKTFKTDCLKILELLKEYGAQKIVMGFPLDGRGEEGVQAKKVRFFLEGLQKFLAEQNFSAEIDLWDESLTSVEAHAVLIEAGLGRKKRGKVVDKLAAVFILQSYLDQQ